MHYYYKRRIFDYFVFYDVGTLGDTNLVLFHPLLATFCQNNLATERLITVGGHNVGVSCL